MVKKAKGKDVQTGRIGGGGNFEGDTSDKLSDMRVYEKGLLNPEIFVMLADLEVMTDKTDKADYEYLILEKSDFEGLIAKSMGSAGHAINSQFAAMQIPYRAVPFASKEADKVTKTRETDDGEEEYETVETDCLKIYRTGEEFNPALYAVKDGEDREEFGLKVSTKGDNKGNVLTHETYTVGQKLRADRWIVEVAAEEIDSDVLEKIGIVVE